jgi:hypothetical protein
MSRKQIDTVTAWGRDDLMAIAAFRYCFGRMSYIVSDCVDWLILIWPDLQEHTRAVILRDIKEGFECDRRQRNGKPSNPPAHYGTLGMSVDKREWERFLESINVNFGEGE